MDIINIFCDASIDKDKRIACAGCYIVKQDARINQLSKVETISLNDVGYRRMIQHNATNNSSEILAIWLGVIAALDFRKQYPNAIFRLFSDSKISLYGLRDWIKFWISRMTPEGILISSAGTPVVNQQKFIEIFNLVVMNNLRIELYHQRGHVNDRHIPIDITRSQFIKANKVPPEELGITMNILSDYNCKIDRLTREASQAYAEQNILLPYTEIEGFYPMEFILQRNLLHQYIRCIDKTSVRSRHDFKGGYNQ